MVHSNSKGSVKEWNRRGTPWVWLNAGAVSICVLMVVGLVGLIAARGLVYFWPHQIVKIELFEDSKSAQDKGIALWAGNVWGEESVPAGRVNEAGGKVPEDQKFVTRTLYKTGNRELDGFDFRWFSDYEIKSKTYPKNLVSIERREWGNFFGVPQGFTENGNKVKAPDNILAEFDQRLNRALELHEQVDEIEINRIGDINYAIERIRLQRKKFKLDGGDNSAALAELKQEEQALNDEYDVLQVERNKIYAQLERDELIIKTIDGREKIIQFQQIVSYIQPNTLSLLPKIGIFFENVWRFLSEDPREANTEGGVFPAIFGTVVMVLIMSLMVTPFGVIAAVYLREYAKQGFITRTVRIAVNNLAGVPSIVYGVFGLGFFVYFLGGSLDALFYPEMSPAPMFGTPGLFWASLTLALLTVPVVIVSTEEGLSRIPRAVREGSYALGATKFETLTKVIIPMSSPSIMTGMILAVARAAGEVAPLMLVGVVKLAPTLPFDGNYPFLHLERKFMHLGFHIYDVGFQSPNVEAVRPLVYATALLLIIVIGVLNLSAVQIRNRLRERYKSIEI